MIDADRLDATIAAWVGERDLAGTVLLTHAGRTVFEGCYGPADRACDAPVTPRTRFGTASVTKMVTAVTVVDLVRRGLLPGLDRPVVGLLPPDRRPSTLRDDVTVHHLLSHTSGIADYCEEDEDHPDHVADYAALWETRPSYRMERPADFLPLFGDRPPDRPPGVRYAYSNAGYVLLGLLVEDAAGRPFADVVRDHVLHPAGMSDSGFLRLDEAHPDVAVGYSPRPSPAAPWRSNLSSVPVVGGGDGGLMATARDLDRFLTAYDDGTLLGEMRDVVLHPHAEIDGARGVHGGYGVYLFPDGRFGHDGGDPGVEAVVARWPGDGTNLVVLCSVEGVLRDVRDTVLAAWRG